MSDPTAHLDFTEPRWGHSLHGGSWKIERRKKWWKRLGDLISNRRWFSVIVHSDVYPRPGTLVRYLTEEGVATAVVYRVDSFGDPLDMFYLMLFRDRKVDAAHNMVRK